MNKEIVFSDIISSDIELSHKLHDEYCGYLRSLGIQINTTPFEDHKMFVNGFMHNSIHPFKKWYMVNWNNKKIGYVVIKKTNEFGYVILEEYRGKGLGTKMFEEFFKIHPKNTVWARSKKENKRSHHMLEKFGFEVTDFEFH